MFGQLRKTLNFLIIEMHTKFSKLCFKIKKNACINATFLEYKVCQSLISCIFCSKQMLNFTKPTLYLYV